MYPSAQLSRIHHDEWLRYAETRRLIKQARAASGEPARARLLPRLTRPALRFSNRQLGRA